MTIRVSEAETVSALFDRPEPSRACYVLAHGAGAGMNHAFMAAVSAGLVERSIATLRYQFPFMQRGSKRPDSPLPRTRNCARGGRGSVGSDA